MLDWQHIDNVFLDMDGTLLDLYFDNHFWREHVPLRYAERHGLDMEGAKAHLFPRFQAVEGTMEWYCVDYWSRELDLDIAELKREIDHLIAIHPHVVEFLDAVRAHGKHVALVTNAHAKSLEIKMERTQLGGHFDKIICSHDYGKPKEDDGFWHALHHHHPFARERTLLVDDSLPVLRAAREYGIAWCLCVRRPDTRAPARDIEGFEAIENFSNITPRA